MGELLNSKIGILYDFVEQQDNPRIRATKDIAAAAVGIGIFVGAEILVIEGIQLLAIV